MPTVSQSPQVRPTTAATPNQPPPSPRSPSIQSKSSQKMKKKSSMRWGGMFSSSSSSKARSKLRIRTSSSDAASQQNSTLSPSVLSTTSSTSSVASLGTGQMAMNGSITFTPSPRGPGPSSSLSLNLNKEEQHQSQSVLSAVADESMKSVHSVASASTHGTETTLVSSSINNNKKKGNKKKRHHQDDGCATTSKSSTMASSLTPLTLSTTATKEVAKKIIRRSCSFLRVADLEMMDETITTASTVSSVGDGGGDDPASKENNIHHPSVDPPPGVDHDPKELWIAFTTDNDGSHAPIAPYAMDRLADFGLTTSLNDKMWHPADYKTTGLLKKGGSSTTEEWYKSTFRPGKIQPCPSMDSTDVLVWSGSFIHGLYGSDLPAIRAAGMVGMSAKSLFDLLVDSTRVKEYNKLSLGRTDLVSFDGDLTKTGPFGRSITKVMRSETKPPMIRKNLVFESILHAKELVDGSGYLIVTRAIHRPENDDATASLGSVIKSEILMGVNLIRKVEGHEDSKCCMINVNHIRSPMVPMMVAKRIGVSSAVGFMNDIRALC